MALPRRRDRVGGHRDDAPAGDRRHPPWTSLVVLGYVLAFFLLGLPLRLGMPIGVAYALSFLCLSLSLAAGMHVGVVLIELG